MFRRPVLPAALLAAAAAALTAAPPASAQARTETVTTADGWTLPVDVYLPKGADENTPAVLMVHGEKGNRKNWQSLGEHLQKRGYAAFAPDLRKHGESSFRGQAMTGEKLLAGDHRATVRFDLEAVKVLMLTLHQQKQLNVRKTGVVAADAGAPAGLLFTYADWMKQPLPDAPDPAFRTPTGQDVRAVVLLSPEEAVPGLNPGRVARKLADDNADIAFLVVVGGADARDRGTAARLYEKLGGRQGKARAVFETLPGGLRGTDLLRPPLGEQLQAALSRGDDRGFLDVYVKARPDPWRDRQGRL